MNQFLRALSVLAIPIYFFILTLLSFVPQSQAIEEYSFEFTKIVDKNTPVPDGTGVFSGFSAPAFDQNAIVFGGAAQDQRGIYVGSENFLSKVADLNTYIPDGAGLFNNFTFPSISNNEVFFIGYGVSQVGIYKYDGQLMKIVDNNTPVPGKTTYFVNFTSLSSDNGCVAFECRDNVGGLQHGLGIYEYSMDGVLSVLINENNPVDNISCLNYDSNVVVFKAYVNNIPDNIYTNRNGYLEKIADKSTLIPDGGGKTFAAFGSYFGFDQKTISFYGYASEDLPSSSRGIYIDKGEGLFTLVDRNTLLPGNVGTFTRFSVSSLDNNKGVFRADNTSKAGLFYTDLNGNFYKVIESDDSLDGKIVQGLSIGNKALYGNALAFTASFTDGSSGIYRADILSNAIEINVPSFTGNQNFISSEINYYKFTLTLPNSLGIISTGSMDLQGSLYQIQSNEELAPSPDLDHSDHISHRFTDIAGVNHENFMIRPGNWVSYDTPWTEPCGGPHPITAAQYRQLPAGTYYLAVGPDDGASSSGAYGILLLKKPTSSDDFFEGLSLLVNDDDTSNDYLDIYFRVLYPEIYDQNINWSHTINFGVSWARQCKALVNVYLMYVLNECPLQRDDYIRGRFAQNTSDSVFNRKTDGKIIYNNNPEPEFGNIDDAQRGDVFIRGNLQYPIYNKKGKKIRDEKYQHYGLYYDNKSGNRSIIDENWRSDGRIIISDTEASRYNDSWWKVARP